MKPVDRIMARQAEFVAHIIADETWLEGERRQCAVSPDDPVVLQNVCAVVLRIGAEMRAKAESNQYPQTNRDRWDAGWLRAESIAENPDI